MHPHVTANEVLQQKRELRRVEDGVDAAKARVEEEVRGVEEEGVGQLVDVGLFCLTTLILEIRGIDCGLFIVQRHQFFRGGDAHKVHVSEHESYSKLPVMGTRVRQPDGALEYGEFIERVPKTKMGNIKKRNQLRFCRTKILLKDPEPSPWS